MRLIAAPGSAECGKLGRGQLTWAQFNRQLSELEPAGWMDPAEMHSSPGAPGVHNLLPSLKH